ncbi:MAG: hypothetical protein NC116_09595 [Clostridium sp.]|nr:hypothetical protein [Clostridium sp.]
MDSTKVIVDSIKAVISCSTECSAPKQEWYANWDSVAIVAIISLSLIAIVNICIEGSKSIKEQESKSRKESDDTKREREKEDYKNRREAELKERKLNLLKECCYEETKTSDGKKEKKLKAYNSAEITKYLEELNS